MSNRPIMSRLRRANPVPRPRDGDAADLFARITALPADPRLEGPRRRRPLRRRRAVVLAFATLLLAALLASTAVAVSHWIGGDLVEPPVTREEYLDAQKQLTLPPGAEWPDPLDIGLASEPDNSVTSRGAGGGMAVLIAMNAWECYWAEALRTGEGAAARRAQAKLNALLTNNVLEAPAGDTSMNSRAQVVFVDGLSTGDHRVAVAGEFSDGYAGSLTINLTVED